MGLKITTIILWIIAALFGIFGFIIFFFTIFHEAYFNTSFQFDTKLASEFGGFFGGFIGTMFTITSVLLILATLIKQNIENRKSQDGSNFFKMLDYHNENVKQLNISDIKPKKSEKEDKKKEYEKIKGRRAFVIFKLQLIELFKVVNRINNDLNLNYSKDQIADIVYISFYYGIDKDWTGFSKKKFANYERADELAEKLIEEKEKHIKKIGRTNQTSLSSYYRNLYNAVKLIDSDYYLSKNEKKQYVKILRAQLSNPELYVFFFDVISRFGKKWKENNFIIKYELTKNIPLDYLGDYNPKDYFPMEYEEDELN